MGTCGLCQNESKPFLIDRPDFEYGVAHSLSYERCIRCELVFANPMPCPDLIPSFYALYSTHQQQVTSIFSKIARRRTLNETVRAIGPDKNLRILDYGCGNGKFLEELRNRGYCRGVGYDFDPMAVTAANLLGIDATNNWENIQGLFDVVTLNHVVEHLVDPVSELKNLSTLLKPGGLIVVRTPNNRSLMSSICGMKWRGWETPRHLNIMNNQALRILMLKSGFEVTRCFSSKAMFFGVFHETVKHSKWLTKSGKMVRHILALTAYPWGAGEESVGVGRKEPAAKPTGAA